MQRQIEFRGKTNQGKWEYGDLVHNAFDGSKIIEVGIQSERCYPVEVIPETIGQLVKEKKGEKLYEGDIVVSKSKFYETDYAKVVWLTERCGFYFVAKCIGTDLINRNPYESAYKINSQKVEVIGNIHDTVHEAHISLLTDIS